MSTSNKSTESEPATVDYAHHPVVEIGWSSNFTLEEDSALMDYLFEAVYGVMKAHGADRNLYMNGTLRPPPTGLCDNCGESSEELAEYTRLRPDSWALDQPFRLCRGCLRNVERNLDAREQ